MSEYQMALLIGAIITAIIATKLPRASLWIAGGALSFIFSTAYYRYGYPHYPLFTLACDGLLCIAIYSLAKEIWELWLMRLYRFSVFVSLIYSSLLFYSPTLANHYLYVLILEIINWLALAVIAGTRLLGEVKADEVGFARTWVAGFRGHYLSLRKARSQAPWHKVGK